MAKKQLFEEKIIAKNNIKKLTENQKKSNKKANLANEKIKQYYEIRDSKE